MLTLMAITNDPQKAQQVVAAGVNRIFVDLEIHGKHERQPGGNTVISEHTFDDIGNIRKALPSTEILARINPIYEDTPAEVDAAIDQGADVIMLPMFTHPDEVHQLVGAVGKRAKICLLVETPQALVRMPTYLDAGIDEIYVGLNDMHSGMKLTFMFELLAGGIVEYAAQQATAKGIAFGFGGIGCMGSGDVPAERILGEHVRIGSSLVILSRTFTAAAGNNVQTEVDKLRAYEAEMQNWTPEQFEDNRKQLAQKIWHKAFS